MRIITCNVNGIRAAARKGFFDWMAAQEADVVCLQETKAQEYQLGKEITDIPGYRAWFCDAEKKGYSGVAVYSRHEPKAVQVGLGWPDMDAEGRYLQLDFDGVSVASLYLPSGTSGEERQNVKYSFLDRFLPHLRSLRRKRREYVICGDWNIAHSRIDLKNWRGNQKNSGFLPEERAWMDQLFGKAGYVDAFREINPEPDQYTWWSNRGQAWAKNVGWRIDYHVVTPALGPTVQAANIYKKERFSDHAPLTIDYALEIG
jgi:exodeoxyribonuclease-3